MSSNLPIALFDSGVGGLTVLRQLTQVLPNESFIYLGDTARVPYGTRSPEVIQKYSVEAAAFLIEKKIKLLLVACHTASSHALSLLQKQYKIPIIGVVNAGLQELLKETKTNRVAILATQSTIQSGIYQTLIQQNRPSAQIFSIPCPLFVPMIEEGWITHQATKLIVDEYLLPLKGKNIDAALLACTHYPLIRELIQFTLGPNVKIIDPSKSAAYEVWNYLNSTSQLNQNPNSSMQFYSTDDPKKFETKAKLFFGEGIYEVLQANIGAKLD